ncbi:hypothetical protein Tdes44962_MAKER05258 [Teratosphaeria destructans]|uniref:C2H2-type domain-containing protein n=1 Tax=Teratosphaeria destructans TaxID=418781 RepID=A0A9W7SK45_9PEZI|nr:hypothetical protein Tdes44962_MAKER05258 [Teratosphaeria destructans]
MGLISTTVYKVLFKELQQLYRRHDSGGPNVTEPVNAPDFADFYEADTHALICLTPWLYTGQDQVFSFQLPWESTNPGPPCFSCLERRILCDRRKPDCARCNKLAGLFPEEDKCHYPKVLGSVGSQSFTAAQESQHENQFPRVPSFDIPPFNPLDEAPGEQQGSSSTEKMSSGKQEPRRLEQRQPRKKQRQLIKKQEQLTPEQKQSEPETPPQSRHKAFAPQTPHFKCDFPGCDRTFPRETGMKLHRTRSHGPRKDWPPAS